MRKHDFRLCIAKLMFYHSFESKILFLIKREFSTTFNYLDKQFLYIWCIVIIYYYVQ